MNAASAVSTPDSGALLESLRTLNSVSKADLVTETIIKRIQSGEFKKDSPLPPESALTQMLGVGRSTLREAVKQLVSQNILEIRRGKGTFVRSHPGVQQDPFGFRFIKDKLKLGVDLCEVRLLIEPPLAATAANVATPSQIERIEAADAEVARYVKSGWPHEQTDIEFHSAIADCSDNLILKSMMQVIYSGIPYLINITDRKLCQQAVETHGMVTKAIRSHDPDAAAAAMRLHLVQNRDSLRARLKAEQESRQQ
jgi:DNA-binding FadR family transcriptional regulator